FAFSRSNEDEVVPATSIASTKSPSKLRKAYSKATLGWHRTKNAATPTDQLAIINIRGTLLDSAGHVFYLVIWNDNALTWESPDVFDSWLPVLMQYENARFKSSRRKLTTSLQNAHNDNRTDEITQIKPRYSLEIPISPPAARTKTPMKQPAARENGSSKSAKKGSSSKGNGKSDKGSSRNNNKPAKSLSSWFDLQSSKLLANGGPQAPKTTAPLPDTPTAKRRQPATASSLLVISSDESDLQEDRAAASNSKKRVAPASNSSSRVKIRKPTHVSYVFVDHERGSVLRERGFAAKDAKRLRLQKDRIVAALGRPPLAQQAPSEAAAAATEPGPTRSRGSHVGAHIRVIDESGSEFEITSSSSSGSEGYSSSSVEGEDFVISTGNIFDNDDEETDSDGDDHRRQKKERRHLISARALRPGSAYSGTFPTGGRIASAALKSSANTSAILNSACGLCSEKFNIASSATVIAACRDCGIAYHVDCYKELVSRFDFRESTSLESLKTNFSSTWTCEFCHLYSYRSVDKLLTWRSHPSKRQAAAARISRADLSAVDVVLKWKGISYRHLDWVPFTWLEATKKTSKPLRSLRLQINSGLAPPKLEDTFDSSYLAVDSIIGVVACSPESARRRVQQLSTKELQISADECNMYTHYDALYVAWRGLDISEATWEPPPNPSTEPEDYSAWYSAYKVWCVSEVVSLNKHKAVISKQAPATFKEFGVQPDYILGGTLYKYQLEGANWLWYRWNNRSSAILADEMGLGKTIQVITFLSMVYHSTIPKSLKGIDATSSNTGMFPFLIVVPTTLVANWLQEFRTWAPDLVVATYSARAAERDIQLERTLFNRDANRRRDLRCHVVLTTYKSICMDASSASFFGRDLYWQSIVFDEGHNLKNDKTIVYNVLSKLKTRQHVILTGTPLQNDIRELFNLMHFVDPSNFSDPKELEARFRNDIARNVEKIHDLIRPYILRRTKEEIPSLVPPKYELILPVSMTKVQRELCKATLTKNIKLLRNIQKALHSNDAKVIESLRG
ncbi:hypothetical protein GGI12_005199, partial [Dipsacomyces acuminosporus]